MLEEWSECIGDLLSCILEKSCCELTVDGTRLCVSVWETCRVNELANFVLGFVAWVIASRWSDPRWEGKKKKRTGYPARIGTSAVSKEQKPSC